MASAVVGLELPSVSPVTLGASPLWWSMPQLAPWVIRSLWLNWGWASQGFHGLAGWSRTAILYWSRSWYPVSIRTMNARLRGGLGYVRRRLVGIVSMKAPIERRLVLDDLYWYS